MDNLPPVLDACCGSRMFWFDRKDARALCVDSRREVHSLKDKSSKGGFRELVIQPDIMADFTKLPFVDQSFSLVIFDPPHLIHAGKKGWLAKKYGVLKNTWEQDLRCGFSECFRVLKISGTLIFKWSEHDIPLKKILSLTSEQPLISNRSGKHSKSHWIVFIKTYAN